MLYIRESIIVEGDRDQQAVLRAVSALVFKTRGLNGLRADLAAWAPFAAHGGLVILTDPDSPGDRLRARITAVYPTALQAQLPTKACRGPRGRLGIQFADPAAIREALLAAGCRQRQAPPADTLSQLIQAGFGGGPAGAQNRRALTTALGLPQAPAPRLASYLNALDLTPAQALSYLHPKD
ncbi:toprim domain-containing protein [Peptococcus simiae]|uniref:toprim domain-containing protein n=1 Tax=Peptococcus simiae TaxID=1643805 RepID=UPI00397EC51D